MKKKVEKTFKVGFLLPGRMDPGLLLTLFMVISYAAVYSCVSIFRISHFDGQSGFDLAIPDQALWLMSNLKNPFSTVRGLHLFGDHTPYIYLFLVPAYVAWNNINTLLILQSTALAIGAVGIYLIAKHVLVDARTGRKKSPPDAVQRFAPVVFAWAYLMYPALNYLNQDLLFSESFEVPLLIFAFYFAIKGMFRLFATSSILAMLCKEDAAISVFALAAYVYWKLDKRYGAAVAVTAVAWFAFNMGVLLPYFNGFGYFRHLYGYGVLGRLGRGPADALANVANNPGILTDIVLTGDNGRYFADLFSPVLFTPLLALDVAAIALPVLATNMISGYYYTHFIKYHYTAALIPFVIIATIYGCRRASGVMVTVLKKPRIGFTLLAPLLAALIASTVYSNYAGGGDFNLVRNGKNVLYALENMGEMNSHIKVMEEAVSQVPADASVSASYDFLTHLSHRDNVYMFTTPFKPAYWGINGENMPSERPQYLIIDAPVLDADSRRILDGLIANGTYAVTSNREGIMVLVFQGTPTK